MNMNSKKMTMVRIDKKQQRHVSSVTIQKLIDRLKTNVDNEIISTLRYRIRSNDRFVIDKHKELHRIYASAWMKKADNGALVIARYNDMLLLSAGPIIETERLEQLKQVTKIVPSTMAAFMGASGRTLKILVHVTLPEMSHRGNEAEMEQFYSKAYQAACSIYSSLLNVPVVPSGIKDGSSPIMARCCDSADDSPLLIEKTTPLNINGVELIPKLQTESEQRDTDNEVSSLIAFLMQRYDFRYNTVRGATEYLDKQYTFWGWRLADMRFINGLSIDAREAGIEARPKDVMTYLNSSRIRVVDPIDDYIFSLSYKWDGHDHIGDLADRVTTDREEWKQWLRVWF